jgi:hypothetical protein
MSKFSDRKRTSLDRDSSISTRWPKSSKPLGEFAKRFLILGEQTISKSIQEKTSKQYSKKFEEWRDFVTKFNDHDQQQDEYLSGMTLSEKSAIGLAFMSFLYYDKGLSPSTISNYMSAIRFQFQVMMEQMPWEEDFAGKRFMRGALLNDAALGIQRDKKRPIPLSMILHIVNVKLDKSTIEDAPCRIAVLIAYFFLLRQSEYIYQKQSNDHAIRVSDVEFRIRGKGVFIQSHLLRTSGYHIRDIDLVKVTLRHCKNDPFRQGNSFWCEREFSKNGSIDLVREMAEFSWSANCISGDVYTSCRLSTNKNKTGRATYSRMMELIKSTAVHFGFESHIFGTHSFRISGATTLDAGAVDSRTVQRLGGWAVPQTALEYTQANTGAFTLAHRALLNPNNFTIADLQLQIQTKKTRQAQQHLLPGKKDEIPASHYIPEFVFEEDLMDGVQLFDTDKYSQH